MAVCTSPWHKQPATLDESVGYKMSVCGHIINEAPLTQSTENTRKSS